MFLSGGNYSCPTITHGTYQWHTKGKVAKLIAEILDSGLPQGTGKRWSESSRGESGSIGSHLSRPFGGTLVEAIENFCANSGTNFCTNFGTNFCTIFCTSFDTFFFLSGRLGELTNLAKFLYFTCFFLCLCQPRWTRSLSPQGCKYQLNLFPHWARQGRIRSSWKFAVTEMPLPKNALPRNLLTSTCVAISAS